MFRFVEKRSQIDWQGRFKSQAVGKDEYFIQCGKYIELNPLRAKITKSPESYPYSSFAYYTSGRQDGLVTEDIFFEGLGQNAVERQNEYRKLVVSEVIQESYPKESWGSSNQRYNENKKLSDYQRRVS